MNGVLIVRLKRYSSPALPFSPAHLLYCILKPTIVRVVVYWEYKKRALKISWPDTTYSEALDIAKILNLTDRRAQARVKFIQEQDRETRFSP